MGRAVEIVGTICVTIVCGFIILYNLGFIGQAHPTELPNSLLSPTMRTVMFDPTPMGATIFDKDFGKCPK